MRLWPRSLFGRVALVLCCALALAHGLTYLAILRERGTLAQNMMLSYFGRDVAASVAMLDRLPAAERVHWLARLARHNYSYQLADQAKGPPLADNLPRQLSAVVATELGAPRVGVMTGDDTQWRVRLRLADGSPLTLSLTPPRTGVSAGTLWLLLVQLVALGAAAWLAVRLATRPLAQLAQAADRLGHHQQVTPLGEHGPQEVVAAARAFNAMQSRIDHHIAERLHTLAAITHDLQSPITRMRLRADMLADDTVRDKLLADLSDMQHLVTEGLAFARSSHAAQEAPRAIDLHALLDGLVCDAVDAGDEITLEGRYTPPLVTRPEALRRLLGNLLDNARKFGGGAPVSVHVENDAQAVHIAVRDQGPGIPEDQLHNVMQPFVRLEASRSRHTGGTGLGLSIAQQLATALGAALHLSNLEGGGLQARLSLPRDPLASRG